MYIWYNFNVNEVATSVREGYKQKKLKNQEERKWELAESKIKLRDGDKRNGEEQTLWNIP